LRASQLYPYSCTIKAHPRRRWCEKELSLALAAALYMLCEIESQRWRGVGEAVRAIKEGGHPGRVSMSKKIVLKNN
jgi:hypothetical protein